MRCSAAPVLALFLLSPLALAAGNKDPRITQAEALLAKRQPASAYQLLAPLEDELSGNPDFDYVLGQAALESGQAGVAAFAFERCLSVDPRNGPCRVQMARTHLALGENGSARRELNSVQASQPPAEVSALVSRYLGTLEAAETRARRNLTAYAQIGLGYDSNASSATDQLQVALPAFGGALFTLGGASVKDSDAFAQVAAGASLEYRLSPAWSLLADGAASTRHYASVNFDNLSADLGAGLGYRSGHHNVLAKLQLQDYQLDGDDYRRLAGLLGQYQYSLSDLEVCSAYVQGSQLDYRLPGTEDASRYTLGMGCSRALKSARSPVYYLGLYGGQETPETKGVGNGQDFYGLRAGGSLSASANWRLTGSISVEGREFDGVNAAFCSPTPPFTCTPAFRKDTATDLSLGAIWRPAGSALSVRPTYSYSRSNSNVVLNDYDRHVVSVDLRYER